MSLHQQHENKRPDSEFLSGTMELIVPGNRGRLLDGRRTPGMIERYDERSAMFVWRITGFEDQGKCWVIPADKIASYQFEKYSAKLDAEQVRRINQRCAELDKRLVVSNPQEYDSTRAIIDAAVADAKAWLLQQDGLHEGQALFNLSDAEGSPALYDALTRYMQKHGVLELEERTAAQLVLNPYSGEWIKGMRIIMAGMGLIDFDEKIPRTEDIFTGIGQEEQRRKYIIHRMAFVQAVFSLMGMASVPLYRGMTTTEDLHETPKTLLSATFSPDVALEFADFSAGLTDVKYAYCVKFPCPIEHLFMTYFETKSFNGRYKEKEALILYRNRFIL